MKPIYDFLQNNTVALCIFFGISPRLPAYFQRNGSDDLALYYSAGLCICGCIVLFFCMLWLRDPPLLQRPSLMVALTFGSLLGVLIGGSAFLGLHGSLLGNYYYGFFAATPSQMVIAIMFLILAYNIMRRSLTGSKN